MRQTLASCATCGGLLLAGLLSACHAPPQAADASADLSHSVYAAPGGWSGGEGTLEQPLDLGTVLSNKSPIKPGGTVWLRGGTFRGAFTSTLMGTAEAPITVRPYPGEHVIIDAAGEEAAALTVNGTWTIVRDLEITNSHPTRTGDNLKRGSGVDVHGPHTKIVNMVVHDLGGGIGLWSDATEAEAYGNIIYYNGWMGTQRSHGHGIYTQNKEGTRRIVDNVIFSQFGIGLHAYGSDEAFLDDLHFEGNILFNNGSAGDFNILLGGHRVANRPTLIANYTYDFPGAGNNIGYDAGCADLTMRDNYFAMVKGGYAVQLVNCGGTVEGNTLAGNLRGVDKGAIVTPPEFQIRYPKNEFIERPSGMRVVVRPNRHTPGRAHVIVFNWDRAETAAIDLSPLGLPLGGSYEVRDVRNLSAEPLAAGTYIGHPVRVALQGLTPAAMVGWKETPSHLAPEFAVFVVTSSPTPPSTTTAWVAKARRVIGF